MKYLLIKNWDVYQPDEKLKDKYASLPWVKDYTDKVFDTDYMNLTFYQRYVLDELCRMRGRLGHDIPYDDPTWVARLLHANRRDASHIAQAIRRLCADGFLIEQNVQLTPREGERDREGDTRYEIGEDRASAVVPKPLKSELKVSLAKSKAASVGEDE